MKKNKKLILEWGIPIFFAISIAVLINKYIFFNIEVPTESMKPTIEVGDKFLVSTINNYQNIKRGDIIVFKSNYSEELFVKRVIGLPNDNVQIEKGVIFVNGKAIKEDYVQNNMETTAEYNVPSDSYLFLGDNRGNSDDARFWKDPYVKRDNIKGKVQLRIYPLNKIGTLN